MARVLVVLVLLTISPISSAQSFGYARSVPWTSEACIDFSTAEKIFMDQLSSDDFMSTYEYEFVELESLKSAFKFFSGHYHAQVDFQVDLDCDYGDEDCDRHSRRGTLYVDVTCRGTSRFLFSYDHD